MIFGKWFYAELVGLVFQFVFISIFGAHTTAADVGTPPPLLQLLLLCCCCAAGVYAFFWTTTAVVNVPSFFSRHWLVRVADVIIDACYY